eukprot:gene12239-12377_t
MADRMGECRDMVSTASSNRGLSRRQKSSSGGVLPTLVILVLLVLCGGLGFSLLANRAHMKQMADQLDKLQDELTYNKNHMHHIEKRQLDVNLAVANEQNTKMRQDLETSNALVEAYKQHLSDEVAAHHQREETWMHIQEEWEKLEKQMEEEINS